MVKFIDNGVLCGYYYVTDEGFTFGDGTEKMANLISKEEERW